jgi:hypothetical protein
MTPFQTRCLHFSILNYVWELILAGSSLRPKEHGQKEATDSGAGFFEKQCLSIASIGPERYPIFRELGCQKYLVNI